MAIEASGELDIPFNDWSSERHAQGRKTATTRTSAYGEPGDRFRDAGVEFELTHVVKVPLGVVAQFFYEEEGAENPDDYVEVWEEIHPIRGFEPDWDVYLHLYREVGTRSVTDFVAEVEGSYIGHCDECGIPLTDLESVEFGHGTYCETCAEGREEAGDE